MNKPVYIFTGFIDAGKTTAIKTSMQDPHFNDGTKSLLISLEDGEIAYDEKFAKKTNSTIINLTYSEFTHKKMEELENSYNFQRVIIEFNGTENLDDFINEGFIKSWELAEVMCFIDTNTFELYINNLRQIFYNHIKNSQVVIFNRYSTQDKRFLRTNIKAINPYTQIIYENTNNQIVAENLEDIFDLTKSVLEINDSDFGLWYLDILDFPSKYEGKKIKLKAKLTGKIENNENAAFFGRKAMVCCEDDIADISVPALYFNLKNIDPDKYYLISGDIHLLNDTNGQQRAVIYIDEAIEAQAPENELVNFS